MTTDNRDWNDDEETLVNILPGALPATGLEARLEVLNSPSAATGAPATGPEGPATNGAVLDAPVVAPSAEIAPVEPVPDSGAEAPEPEIPEPTPWWKSGSKNQAISAEAQAAERGVVAAEPASPGTHPPPRPGDLVPDIAWLVVLKSPTAKLRQVYPLDAPRMEIGRSMDAPIFVDDRTVSTRHAAIRYERVYDRFEFVLYDLASTNGSIVNGDLVHAVVLKDNDRLRLGETDLVFKKVGEPSRLGSQS